MKKNILILFLILSSFVFCDDDDDGGECYGTASKAKDCNSKKVGTSYKYCCFLDIKSDEGSYKQCYPVTESDYKDIKNYINKMEESGRDAHGKVNKLDCKSYYLKLSLLSLLLILF